MDKASYVKSGLYDIISALNVADLPERIQIGNDYIYPRVALERAKCLYNVDNMQYFKSNKENV